MLGNPGDAASAANTCSLSDTSSLYNIYHLEAMNYRDLQGFSSDSSGVLVDGLESYPASSRKGELVFCGSAEQPPTPWQPDQQHVATPTGVLCTTAVSAGLHMSDKQDTARRNVPADSRMGSHTTCSSDQVHDRLYVQCGKNVLAVLTAQQLLQLTKAQVADVADVPDNAINKYSPLGSATAQPAQHQDPHTSGGQQSVVSG